MVDSKLIASSVLSAAVFSLAGALVYFTITLARVAAGVPAILELVQVTQEKVDPIVDEVAEFRKLVPTILEEMEQIRLTVLPPVLDEVAKIRGHLPAILEESSHIRQSIPPILEEVVGYREQIPLILEQVDKIQLQIPAIITEVENVRETIPLIMTEIENVRKTIPAILVEVEAVRFAMPELMDQAEQMLAEAHGAGRKASEGAVSGVFSGIIKAPFSLVASLGSVLHTPQLTKEDDASIEKAARELADNGKPRDNRNWNNKKSGRSGTITILSIDTSSGVKCIVLRVTVYKGKSKLGEGDLQACQQEDGTWVLVE